MQTSNEREHLSPPDTVNLGVLFWRWVYGANPAWSQRKVWMDTQPESECTILDSNEFYALFNSARDLNVPLLEAPFEDRQTELFYQKKMRESLNLC